MAKNKTSYNNKTSDCSNSTNSTIAQTAETAQVIRQGMQRRAHTKIPQIA